MLNIMYSGHLVGILTALNGGNDLIVCPNFVSHNKSVATKAIISPMPLRKSVSLEVQS